MKKYQKIKKYLVIIITIFISVDLNSQNLDTLDAKIDYCDLIEELKGLLNDSIDDVSMLSYNDSLSIRLLSNKSNINPSIKLEYNLSCCNYYYRSLNSYKSLFKDDIKLYSLYFGCDIKLKPDSGSYNTIKNVNRNSYIRNNINYINDFSLNKFTFDPNYSYYRYNLEWIYKYGVESIDLKKYLYFTKLKDSLHNCLIYNSDSIPEILTDSSLDTLSGYYFYNDSWFISNHKINMRAELINTINSVFLLINLYNNNCGSFEVPKEEYTYEEYLELPTCTLLLIRARNLLRHGY